jgi:hypothetical protein
MRHRPVFLLIFAVFALSAITLPAAAQPPITTPQASPAAHVEQTVGITEIAIDYHRPRVNGRQIWGTLVPFDQVWRAGANENTTIRFSTPVKVEGQDLAAGTYGLHTLPTAGSWTVIFSRNSTSWGSFTYDPEEDALRVEVKPQPAEQEEWLSYSFEDLSANGATVALRWEKLKVPFRIEVDTPNLVLANARNELRGIQRFSWQGWFQAAQYAFRNGLALEEAAAWTDRAIGLEENGQTLGLKAQILQQLGRTEEFETTLAKAVEVANEPQLNLLGYAVLGQGDTARAIELFEENTRRHPDSWNVWDSLGEAQAAAGQTADAAKNYKKALAAAPDGQKSRIEGVLKDLAAK